ncbi:EamA/RhaT family transporter [Ralstonia solanacearum]|uniref:DMT family transporter n=1 Tax=Ralstonia solanacearum TaxID=305 RepID=UPI000181726B|nr:DMT family transporter [Ralstonia solanacearum]MDC6180279.1 DMT family transporter [Ralstonia solanacearum]MDC6212819.1 DMT family transporter [Ralstonia solanacearum]MDC6241679.1 DMT family transporter [Ralstonia solanacearum]MDD7803467.1 DMT family transporter [Ralstonia solanacearum]TYZ48948.1 EamA/RhaT family transporter [Ralstonia solanacearum]
MMHRTSAPCRVLARARAQTNRASRTFESTTLNRPQHPLHGIAFLIAAVAFFAAFDTLTKYISTTVPVVMALWFRYLFQMVATGATLLPSRGRSLLRTRRPWLQVARGLLLLLTSLFSFLSLQRMPVGEVTAIVMLTPLLITLVAAVSLGEQVSATRWIFMAGGFGGALMVIRPGGAAFDWGMLLPLAMVAANAAFQVVTSRLASVDEAGTTQFYTGAVGALLLTCLLPFGWQALGGKWWWLLILIGIVSSSGHALLIMAYTRAPVAMLTPYLYMQIGFAMIAGWLVFSHVPDVWSVAGIATIAMCGAAGTWAAARERRMATLASVDM